MNVDEILKSLRLIERPRLSAFFVRRVSATTRVARTRPAPLALKIYWLVVAFLATPLLGSWVGVGAAAIVGAVFAFGGAEES